MKKVILGAIIAPVLLAASGVASANPQMTKTYRCSNGNFTGEIEAVTYKRHLGDGKFSTNAFITKYRINKYNGQGGGNKANIDGELYVHIGSDVWLKYTSFESPDSMYQDGEWHRAQFTLGGYGISSDAVKSEITFTFDKSGSDPKCTLQLIYPE